MRRPFVALAVATVLLAAPASPGLAAPNANAACNAKEITKINAFQDQSQEAEHGYLGQKYINASESQYPGVGRYFNANDRYCADYYPPPPRGL